MNELCRQAADDGLEYVISRRGRSWFGNRPVNASPNSNDLNLCLASSPVYNYRAAIASGVARK